MTGNLVKKGPIIANTVYADNVLVAEDVTISLPAVTPKMQTLAAMGDLDLPLPITEALEVTVNKIGIDKGFIELLVPEKRKFEFRWAQTKLKKDGTQETEGCKVFITGVPKIFFPGGDIAPGENYEGAIPIAVTRYELVVAGKTYILVDKIAGQLVINGKDYAEGIKKLL